MKKTKSCVYIQNAIYLAPDEIRTCCQRFFVDGKLKGDVSLLKVDEIKNITFDDILHAKKNLIKIINENSQSPCSGCYHLKEDLWENLEDAHVETISIENHSICNMKCTYCSDVYYGGLKPKYKIQDILEGIPHTSKNLHIAWGGGEPTANKSFSKDFQYINKKFEISTQRIFTNALLYSEEIQKAIDSKKISITTSVDAGTEKTFNFVRKAVNLKKVITNLQKYSQVNPDSITIKYIFTDDNFKIDEVSSFFKLISENNLVSCNFLISANFKDENISDEKLFSIITLYFLIHQSGNAKVTLDDHIHNKVKSISEKFIKDTNTLFSSINIKIFADISLLIKSHYSNDIILWGTGEFSKRIISSSKIIQNLNIIGIVDGNPNQWGKIFLNHKVQDPNILLKNNASIIIASSNFYGEIASTMKNMGLNMSRIMPNFLI